MYFGALRTNINSENQKNIIYWSFWPQNCSFQPKSASDRHTVRQCACVTQAQGGGGVGWGADIIQER